MPVPENIEWWREVPWEPAFYDSHDDAWYTVRSFPVENGVKIESVCLSPLRTAPERFDGQPSLFPVIFDALEGAT